MGLNSMRFFYPDLERFNIDKINDHTVFQHVFLELVQKNTEGIQVEFWREEGPGPLYLI